MPLTSQKLSYWPCQDTPPHPSPIHQGQAFAAAPPQHTRAIRAPRRQRHSLRPANWWGTEGQGPILESSSLDHSWSQLFLGKQALRLRRPGKKFPGEP